MIFLKNVANIGQIQEAVGNMTYSNTQTMMG